MAVTSTTAAVLAGAATIVGAGASISSGIAGREQAEAQAEISEQQAERELKLSKQSEEDFRKRQRSAAASVRAAGGGSGVDFSLGSPLFAAEDFARETESQAQRIREGGIVRSTRLEQQADLLKDLGSSRFASGIFGAGSSLLSGGARTARILSEA